MARTPFQVEVLTPEGEAFNDEVEMVSTRTSVGSIGILANHAPLLGMLDPTELRLYKSESDVVRYAQGEGFLQVYGNHVLLLVDEIFEVDELNSSDLEERLSRAESEAREGRGGFRGAARRRARQAPLRGLPGAREGLLAVPAYPGLRYRDAPGGDRLARVVRLRDHRADRQPRRHDRPRGAAARRCADHARQRARRPRRAAAGQRARGALVGLHRDAGRRRDPRSRASGRRRGLRPVRAGLRLARLQRPRSRRRQPLVLRDLRARLRPRRRARTRRRARRRREGTRASSGSRRRSARSPSRPRRGGGAGGP